MIPLWMSLLSHLYNNCELRPDEGVELLEEAEKSITRSSHHTGITGNNESGGADSPVCCISQGRSRMSAPPW